MDWDINSESVSAWLLELFDARHIHDVELDNRTRRSYSRSWSDSDVVEVDRFSQWKYNVNVTYCLYCWVKDGWLFDHTRKHDGECCRHTEGDNGSPILKLARKEQDVIDAKRLDKRLDMDM